VRIGSVLANPEVVIAAAALATMLGLSVGFHLPIVLPSGERAGFVGVHYIYPLIGIVLMGLTTSIRAPREIAQRFLLAVPCYAAVLFAHFNMKLWIPYLNPTRYDAVYWQVDQLLRPLVTFSMVVREALTPLIPYQANAYMIVFIAMFYLSFIYHALKTPEQFVPLILSVLILQFLGSLFYMAAPAIGPFIYEAGVNPIITQGQQGMLGFYRQSLAHGPGWLAAHGGEGFTAGLAAMPSLHAAGAFLFFLFAWRHARRLVPIYALALAYILIAAIASRWHYLVDIPAGIALAWVSHMLADRLASSRSIETSLDVVAGPLLGGR